MPSKAPPCTMSELLAILSLDLGREHKDGWREVHCPYHYKQSKDAVFYVNCEFDSWNCYHACPGCPGVGRNNGIVLTLYMRFTGVNDRAEAAKRIKDHLGRNDLAERISFFQKNILPPQPKTEIADIEIRHKTYSALLDMLSLAPKHLQDLLERGLTAEQVGDLGYKSVPVVGRYSVAKKLVAQGCIVHAVPGFYSNDKGQPMANFGAPGFFIPVRDIRGRIEYLQIRHDLPDASGRRTRGEVNAGRWRKLPKYTNFSSSNRKLKNGVGVPNVAHFAGFPPRGPVPERISFTEGFLKSDISAMLSGTPFVGFGGTSCYSLFEEVLLLLKSGGMREGWECMDKDRAVNDEVMDDIREQYRIAEEAGIPYRPYPWNPRYKGVDDFLAAREKYRQGKISA